jgi:hypothetical protein
MIASVLSSVQAGGTRLKAGAARRAQWVILYRPGGRGPVLPGAPLSLIDQSRCARKIFRRSWNSFGEYRSFGFTEVTSMTASAALSQR